MFTKINFLNLYFVTRNCLLLLTKIRVKTEFFWRIQSWKTQKWKTELPTSFGRRIWPLPNLPFVWAYNLRTFTTSCRDATTRVWTSSKSSKRPSRSTAWSGLFFSEDRLRFQNPFLPSPLLSPFLRILQFLKTKKNRQSRKRFLISQRKKNPSLRYLPLPVRRLWSRSFWSIPTTLSSK